MIDILSSDILAIQTREGEKQEEEDKSKCCDQLSFHRNIY